MAKFWLTEDGKLIAEDGKVRLCNDCPCGETGSEDCDCAVCLTGTVPPEFQVDIDLLLDGTSSCCDEYNGSHIVPMGSGPFCAGNCCARLSDFCLVGVLDFSIDITGITVNLNATFLGTSYVAEWHLDLSDDPCIQDCSNIIDLVIPLVSETGGFAGDLCAINAPTCRITALP